MPVKTCPLKRTARHSQISRTLLFVDPNPLTREWLSRLLQPAGVVAIVATARSEAHEGLKPIDLSILNIGSRHLDDAEVRAELDCLCTRFAEVPLAVLVNCVRPDEIQRALRLGLRGYIPTFLRAHEMLEGLRIVLDNGIFIPATPSTSESTADGHRRAAVPEVEQPCPHVGPLRLTLREAQILQFLREDRTNREIADVLKVAESTVKVHIRHILCELNAENRLQAVEIADRALSRCAPTSDGRAN